MVDLSRVFKVFATSVAVFIFVSASALAQDSTVNTNQPQAETPPPNLLDQAKEGAKKAGESISAVLKEGPARRAEADYFALLNYSPIDFLLPGKYGFTLGAVKNADKTWEFEYLRGSISVPFIVEDLGKMTDERMSLIGRSYFGSNSFNLSYGLSYFAFSMHLGDKLLNRVTGGSYPSIDLIEVNSLGFNAAIGNRWALNKNISFGIDWISWAQPLLITKKQNSFLDYASNQDDRDSVDKATKIIAYFPRIAFLKLQLGVLF